MTDENLARVLDGKDPETRIQDDLFRAVNGAWLESTEIPEDLGSTGAFIELHLESERQVRDIVEELAASQPQEGEARKIADLYRSWMDTDTLNAKGIQPLHDDLSRIEAATSHEELARVTGELLQSGVPSFFDYEVDSSLNDPNQPCFFLGQDGLGLPDEAYYREEQHAEVLEKYKSFVPRMLNLAYGSSDDADPAIALETRLASGHMTVTDSRDMDKINNPMSWDDFVSSTPGFAWEKAMLASGVPLEKLDTIIVTQPEALKVGAKLWADSSLDELKSYMRWRVLLSRSSFLTEDIDTENFNFYGRILQGTTEQRDRWKRGMSLIDGALGEAVGKQYAARHFPPEHKAKMLQLVDDLLEAYRHSISDLEWMSEETKKKALEKVDSFVVKIGYPDEWRDYSNLLIGDDLVENMRAVSRFNAARSFAKLGKPVDRNEWHMTPQQVNAYYNPLWNEIVFPAAILRFPFFDPDRDDALNYGAIGAVIGHEIGHGFDDQGSKFAADGSVTNWWTDADRSAFEDRTAALVAQYNEYVPSVLQPDGPHVQGDFTLGENIGDLGGLSIGLKAYSIALKREGKTFETAEVIDGYTGVQRVFLSWARVWRNKTRKEQAEMRIATDPHSPAEFRANGVVRNIDAFAQAFDLKEGDALYLSPEDRVRIW